MYHQAFHYAPQSISATPPLASSILPHHSQFQQTSRKRTRKAAKSKDTHNVPQQSASASSWGIPDPSNDDEGELSASESDEDEQPDRIDTLNRLDPTSSSKPARKRRLLGLEDVGRFASMSIDRNIPIDKPTDVVSPPEAIDRPTTHYFLPTSTRLKEMTPTSIEEPDDDDEDDVAMRARRGPTTHELEKNRFYVSSLSDDSSDEEDNAEKAKQDRLDDALSACPLETRQDGSFTVNGELINRLQAIEAERTLTLSRDHPFPRRRKGSRQSDGSGHCTPSSRNDQSALILWKSPEEFTLDFGGQPSSLPRHPPIVVEEDGYAFIQRPSPSPSPTVSQPASPVLLPEDAMEVDD